MTIEEIKALIAAKQKRSSELSELIKAEKDTGKLETLVSEAKTVSEERCKAEADLQVALRASADEAIGKHPVSIPGAPAPEEMKLDKRSAICLALGLAARKQMPTDVEKRALDTALTTTATTYVAPTAEVNGVNNAGVFIQTNVVLDLLREQQKLTPILNDILFSNVAGLTVFPFRASRSAAEVKAENGGTGTASWKWDQTTGVKGWLQINIDVTDEVRFQSSIDLGAYILSQLLEDLTYDWAEELIYGIGSGNHVSGIVKGLTAKTYAAGKELDTVASAITSLPNIYSRGAKIYLSRGLANKLYLTKNTDGDYILPIVNGATGISSLVNVPAAIDDTLHDGEAVIGNVGSNFKANLLSPIHPEQDRDINKHITSYNVSVYACTIAVVGAFVYVKAA